VDHLLPLRHHTFHPSVLFLTVLAGCGHSSPNTGIRESSSDTSPSLIAQAEREHDFGAAIGRVGQKMGHRYRLSNTTPHDVRITDVINRKSCCGIVEVGSLLLRPGEGTDVEVTLLVGDRFGGIAHETEVVTDQLSDASLVLRTTATAVAALRIEEAPSSGG
jgi:hypothetical protein